MEPPAYASFDVPGYVGALRRQGELLAGAAQQAGLAAAVPSCPGWAGVLRGTGRADCAVVGPASELYLMLWNRGPADRLQVTGDPGVLAAFGRALQITWS